MTRILIVEGNNAEIIQRNRDAGVRIASDMYRAALVSNGDDIACDVSIPFAPELQEKKIRIEDYDGFALTGSGVEWCAGSPETKPYMDHLEEIMSAGKPIIGSCWGMQTVVVAMGGSCAANPQGIEVGLAEEIALTAEGRAHPFFVDMPDQFDSPCIHRDHVTYLPECFTLLASNKVSEIQAASCQNGDIDYFGFQYHPELDQDYLWGIVQRRGMDLGANNVIGSFPEQVNEHVSDFYKRTSVFKHWLLHVAKLKKAAETAALEAV